MERADVAWSHLKISCTTLTLPMPLLMVLTKRSRCWKTSSWLSTLPLTYLQISELVSARISLVSSTSPSHMATSSVGASGRTGELGLPNMKVGRVPAGGGGVYARPFIGPDTSTGLPLVSMVMSGVVVVVPSPWAWKVAVPCSIKSESSVMLIVPLPSSSSAWEGQEVGVRWSRRGAWGTAGGSEAV